MSIAEDSIGAEYHDGISEVFAGKFLRGEQELLHGVALRVGRRRGPVVQQERHGIQERFPNEEKPVLVREKILQVMQEGLKNETDAGLELDHDVFPDFVHVLFDPQQGGDAFSGKGHAEIVDDAAEFVVGNGRGVSIDYGVGEHGDGVLSHVGGVAGIGGIGHGAEDGHPSVDEGRGGLEELGFELLVEEVEEIEVGDAELDASGAIPCFDEGVHALHGMGGGEVVF